jgi:hypothetical protein
LSGCVECLLKVIKGVGANDDFLAVENFDLLADVKLNIYFC